MVEVLIHAAFVEEVTAVEDSECCWPACLASGAGTLYVKPLRTLIEKFSIVNIDFFFDQDF